MIRWAGRQERLNIPYLQRVWGLVYPWMIYQGVSMLVTFVFAYVMMMRDPNFVATAGSLTDHSLRLSEQVYQYYLPLSVVICLITIPVLLFFILRDRKKEVFEGFTAQVWEKSGPWGYALCFLCGVSACVVLNHVLMYSGVYGLLADDYESSAAILYQGSMALELISVGVLTPVAEELIFRGLIFRRLRWALDAVPAMLLSALLFAIFHGNLLQGIYSFAIGVLLAFVYERTHSLLAPVFVHVGANLVSVFLTELEGLQSLYLKGNETAFLLVTGGMMLLFVIAFYLFYARIRPACVNDGTTAGTLSHEREDRYGT